MTTIKTGKLALNQTSIRFGLKALTRSAIAIVAVASLAVAAFVVAGETPVQAQGVEAGKPAAMARIATAFQATDGKLACSAKRVRVVYSGYGETRQQGCIQNIGL